MKILQIQKKDHLLNILERFHIRNFTLQKQQMSDNFTYTNNPIYIRHNSKNIPHIKILKQIILTLHTTPFPTAYPFILRSQSEP
jgi:hypothetical protein